MDKSLVKQIEQELDAEFLPDTKTHINRIKIPSETSNNLYTVSQTRLNGIWQCACFGFRRHRNCKHLKAIVPMIESASKPAKAKPKALKGPSEAEKSLERRRIQCKELLAKADKIVAAKKITGKYKKAIEVLLKYDYGTDETMTAISNKFEAILLAETFDLTRKQVAKDIKNAQKEAKKKS